MSSISAISPRPILKRSSQSHPDNPTTLSPLRIPRQCSNTVHFPPSPVLARTFSAYSSSTYDRSPIVVLPNICALPARGCPGRTYLPGCTVPISPSTSPDSDAHKSALKAKGKHMHPRCALSFGLVPEPTPDCATDPLVMPPPLVPDVSSESDESDGLMNSPSCFDANATATSPLSSFPVTSFPDLKLGESMLHSPESPDEEEYQYYTYEEEKRRRRRRDRGKGGREQSPRQRTRGHDQGTRDLERKPTDGDELEEDDEAEDDDIAEGRYKSFYSGTTLRGCGLDTNDDTCLGGF
ncbi:hypothetical protein EDB84DRAFT_1486560 [Lactarius hengduanensis]|nr:hypothetical protein EDB84DRAFT_1486560 [Lactarius hengduanensis]